MGVTYPSRTWVLALEEGEEIPAHVLEAVSEQDTVAVQRYGTPLWIERQGDWSYGYCYWRGGAMIVWPDHLGKPYKVK